MERMFKIAMLNTRLNFRSYIVIEACSCSEASGKARKALGPHGYNIIESITCIA